MGAVVDKVTQTFIGVAGINQQNMGALLIILPYKVVGKERLAGA